MAAVNAVEAMIQFPRGGRVISWLPNAHVAERNAHHYLPVVYGLQVTCCPNPREVLPTCPRSGRAGSSRCPGSGRSSRPAWRRCSPRQPDEQRGRVQAALEASLRKVRLEQAGEPVPADLAAAVAEADASGLRRAAAHARLRRRSPRSTSARRPRRSRCIEFFHAIGVPLAELWGMSETCGRRRLQPARPRSRSARSGRASPGTEARLAEDGELLVRSDVVMLGYRSQPEKTAEAIDADGWLHTGDIAEIDDDGYVRIVDRKKELIINAAGKNMSPANIEATLKARVAAHRPGLRASATRGPTTRR